MRLLSIQAQEKVIKINEKLASKGKQLHEISNEEFEEIADSIGLKKKSQLTYPACR